jgi:hypothetical protein
MMGLRRSMWFHRNDVLLLRLIVAVLPLIVAACTNSPGTGGY